MFNKYIKSIKTTHLKNDFEYTISNCGEKNCVLYIIVPQKEGSLGGSDAHVFDLSRELLNNGKYFPIVLFTHNIEYKDKLYNAGISYIYTNNCNNYFKIAKKLSSLPKKYNIKIMHSHQYNANYLACMIKIVNCIKWKKIPLVMTAHGWIETSLKLKIMTFFDFLSYFLSESIICVCDKDENRLRNKKYINNKKIYCILNGINIPIKFTSDDIKRYKKEFGIDNNNKIVSFVGRLSQEKRIDLFILTAKEILTKREDVVFLIAGNGNENTKMQYLINKYQLGEKVKYLGFVIDIKKVHMISDFILLTSDTEGTPRAILEAMSYSTIPICTNVGGLKHIINNNVNGFLCESNNVDDIFKKLLGALSLSEKKYNSISNNAKNTIKNKFLIKDMCNSVINVYDDLNNGG